MGSKRKQEIIEEQEPLSNYQDISKTGRVDVRTEGDTLVVSGDGKKVLELMMGKGSDKSSKAIEITSGELVDQMFCNYKYKHTVGPNTTNIVTTKSEVPVHHELVAAFRKLDPHLALICEEVDTDLIGDINDIDHEPTAEKIQKFTVTKFSVEGNSDVMSVVLKGEKELTTGEAIKLETPKILVDDSYPFATELSSTIQDCIGEIEAYMHGKQAENPQTELPFGEQEEGEKYTEEDL